MKKSKFSEAQIIKILNEFESGRSAKDICRKYKIAVPTFYSWKRKYSGMDALRLKEFKTLKEENERLKRMYADLSLDHRILKDVIEKKL